jgi:stage V sporulation protein R
MTNFGQPIIKVLDGNFENRGELLIGHMWEGMDMQPDYLTETLKNLFFIWGRPVNLATVMDGEGQLYRFDGEKFENFKSEDDQTETKDKDKSDLPSGGQNSSGSGQSGTP